MKRKNMMWLAVVAGWVGLLALGAWAETYTYIGTSVGYWCGINRWTRTGCGSPCEECPDDTLDDGTFITNGTIIESNVDVRNLVITSDSVPNPWVQFGKNNDLSCSQFYTMNFKSIRIAPTSGTAKLQGGACTTVTTN